MKSHVKASCMRHASNTPARASRHGDGSNLAFRPYWTFVRMEHMRTVDVTNHDKRANVTSHKNLSYQLHYRCEAVAASLSFSFTPFHLACFNNSCILKAIFNYGICKRTDGNTKNCNRTLQTFSRSLSDVSISVWLSPGFKSREFSEEVRAARSAAPNF